MTQRMRAKMNYSKSVPFTNQVSRCSTYPTDGEYGVVGSNFLGTSVTASTVGNEDTNTSNKRNASHGKDKLLLPWVSVLGPRGHLALTWEGSSSVEDRERG